ncbi:hypothetical protein Sinac_6308 [Singulisphaera acidiphila DSM 18658]|uniref:DUF4112 domain-containing protein n=2 Tax=Singulisphaera acidiphila TaxID=466153 RepID=L0DM00_SINAD|nr:hypothetical protein Sinac_6308 [Singulisphaera acidiphila DSM 18658]
MVAVGRILRPTVWFFTDRTQKKEGRTTLPSLKPTIEPKRSQPPGMEGLEQLAWLMDRAFQIPGTKIRVGLDALLGLLPVGGDFLTGIVQVGLVLVALKRYHVPKPVAARMAANVLLDTTLGSIPLLGDLFDVAFKANTRNIKLLQQVAEQRQRNEAVSSKSSILFLVGLAGVLLLALGLVFIGFVTVIAWLVKRL